MYVGLSDPVCREEDCRHVSWIMMKMIVMGMMMVMIKGMSLISPKMNYEYS